MMREETKLVAATAALARTLAGDQRAAFLGYIAENVRTTLVRTHANMSSAEVEARVRRHVAAVCE